MTFPLMPAQVRMVPVVRMDQARQVLTLLQDNQGYIGTERLAHQVRMVHQVLAVEAAVLRRALTYLYSMKVTSARAAVVAVVVGVTGSVAAVPNLAEAHSASISRLKTEPPSMPRVSPPSVTISSPEGSVAPVVEAVRAVAVAKVARVAPADHAA